MSFGFGTSGTGGFNFGNTAPTNNQPSTSTNSFGFGTTNPSTPSTGFNFGNTPQQSTNTFGTGFNQTSNPSATSFGSNPSLFGTTGTTGTNGFNFNTGSSLGNLTVPLTRQDTTGPGMNSSAFSFGPSATPSTPTLFTGNSNPNPSSFGFGGTSFAPTSMKPPPLTAQQRMQSISEAFNPNSNECRFRHMLYNKVPEGDADKYVKPSNVNERLWYQAVEANPDPKKLVPVQATGFNDLKLRIEEQDKATADHSKALEEIQKFLTSLQRKRDLDTAIKIEQYKRRHVELSHRLLRVMKKIEVLRSKGYSLSLDEEGFRSKLSSLQRELNQPNLFKGRLNELSALIRMQEERQSSIMYETVDDESLEKMHKFLSDQTAALSHIVNILKKDLRDVAIIGEGLSDKGKSDVY